jgi:hypothetical protein
MRRCGWGSGVVALPWLGFGWMGVAGLRDRWDGDGRFEDSDLLLESSLVWGVLCSCNSYVPNRTALEPSRSRSLMFVAV